MKDNYLSQVAAVWDGGPIQGCLVKQQSHSKTAKILRYFAREVLKLDDTQFSVRSNKGGDAVSGDVILHAENIYIKVGQSFSTVLYRKCNGMEDYTGDRNNWMKATDAFGSNDKMQSFARVIQSLLERTN